MVLKAYHSHGEQLRLIRQGQNHSREPKKGDWWKFRQIVAEQENHHFRVVSAKRWLPRTAEAVDWSQLGAHMVYSVGCGKPFEFRKSFILILSLITTKHLKWFLTCSFLTIVPCMIHPRFYVIGVGETWFWIAAEAKGQHQIFFFLSRHFIFGDQVPHWTWSLLNQIYWASQGSPGILSLSFHCWDYKHSTLAVEHRFWVSNSGAYAYKTNSFSDSIISLVPTHLSC